MQFTLSEETWLRLTHLYRHDSSGKIYEVSWRDNEYASGRVRCFLHGDNRAIIETIDIPKEKLKEVLVNPERHFRKLRGCSLTSSHDVSLCEMEKMLKNKKMEKPNRIKSFFGMFRRKHNEDNSSEMPQVELPTEVENAIRKSRKPKKKDLYKLKYKAKHKAKRDIKKRFKIGKNYYLRIKPKDGSREVVMGFVCKKFIYTMNDIPMNIVIMKQVSGEEMKKFTLNKNECKKYHVKYEPGLEVWSMNMNWIPEKNNYSEK